MNEKDLPNFQIGDKVASSALKKSGEILDGPNKRMEYLVVYGPLKIWTPADTLKKIATTRKAKNRPKTSKTRNITKVRSTMKLDLHGMRSGEAIEEVANAINKALMENVEKIEVIHGIGTGTLKKVVLDYLKTAKGIAHFKPDEDNAGVIWIYL